MISRLKGKHQLQICQPFNIIYKMLADPCGKIQRLVGELFTNDRYIEAIKLAETKYAIKPLSIEKLQPNTILQLYYRLSERFYVREKFNNLQNWHQNELKIFVWLLIGYSFLQKRCISEMTDEDWKFFSDIFKGRSPLVIEFQARLLLKNKQKNVKWSPQQTQILKDLLDNSNQKNMWNQIARNLYITSQKKYLRSPKQCREYWINHLDPTPNKKSWTYLQDYKLIQWAYENGKKWSKVSKLFDRLRTQHMVKNRFNSLYHLQLKRDPIGTKNLSEECVMQRLMQRLKSLIKQQSQNANFAKTITTLNYQADQEQVDKNQRKNYDLLNKPVQSQNINIRKQSFDQFREIKSESQIPELSNIQEIHIQQHQQRADKKQDEDIEYSFFNFENENLQFIFDSVDPNS